jgi:hypothetical protein
VPGRRDQKPLHPAGQRGLVLGLDDQVHVGALERDVDDAEPLAQRGRDDTRCRALPPIRTRLTALLQLPTVRALELRLQPEFNFWIVWDSERC